MLSLKTVTASMYIPCCFFFPQNQYVNLWHFLKLYTQKYVSPRVSSCLDSVNSLYIKQLKVHPEASQSGNSSVERKLLNSYLCMYLNVTCQFIFSINSSGYANICFLKLKVSICQQLVVSPEFIIVSLVLRIRDMRLVNIGIFTASVLYRICI